MGLAVAPVAAPQRVIFPWPGAAVDLDFIRRQYWWNGATRLEANFTTFTLNGATFGSKGLDCSTATSNPNVTILLSTLAMTIPPCVCVLGFWSNSAPGTTRAFFQIDDGTANERFCCLLTTAPVVNFQAIDGGVSQSNQGPAALNSLNVRHGIAASADVNNVLVSGDNVDAVADNTATMPTVTTLRLGASPTANSFPPGVLSRFWLFSAVKTQAELKLLSLQMRDIV